MSNAPTPPVLSPAQIKRRDIRIAARALILHEDRLLLVNAFPGEDSTLWCAPGGGAEPGQSLPENLAREVHEETGLTIKVGAPALINEFHSPDTGFHQVELFFHARITHGTLTDDWQDPEQIVTRRRFFSRADLNDIRFKPDSLPDAAWGTALLYDPLERLVKP
ncbi:NUDIX domain-containing protein [Rhodalgimonas zhirmunskyi]|uniref:NUDIX domain-containing protein n=1 Tax=Rhodalgimonas zhirmunskyi TaxID=2964767 RepID=A0AAJ1UFP0_9RHOB|nr:NUDIX domain-containing protein [Rhodoalgimonas zhirmunskyi]MDQ2095042.1 NUDIX domain-containing protein [Rhodoalgimonas zhirmunskyi]